MHAIERRTLDEAFADGFAAAWIDSWNAHELDRILSHYADDLEMYSPFILQIAGEPSGTLRGKAAVRAYWQRALERLPHLRFELLSVLRGVDSIAIVYVGAHGRLAAEVLHFDADGKIARAFAHYAGSPAPLWERPVNEIMRYGLQSSMASNAPPARRGKR